MKNLNWSYTYSSWCILWDSQILLMGFFLRYPLWKCSHINIRSDKHFFPSLLNEPLVQTILWKVTGSVHVETPFFPLLCHSGIFLLYLVVLRQSTHGCCLVDFKVLIWIFWGPLGLFLAALIGFYVVLMYCTLNIPRYCIQDIPSFFVEGGVMTQEVRNLHSSSGIHGDFDSTAFTSVCSDLSQIWGDRTFSSCWNWWRPFEEFQWRWC